jgi:prepilin-type N-terminal cleavage/methylation domain-containing protein
MRGFSLVELAVVVLIVGIIMTMGIGAWTANLENQALAATAQRQSAVKEALSGYLRRNGRLPCPDNDLLAPDGIENRATLNDPTTACSQRFGLLPYVTLGLSRDAVRDGWGNFFSYHVSNTANTIAASGNWSANSDWTTSANFRSGNTGTLTVNDRNGATVTPIATSVVAVIVSHGRNGFGGYTIGGTRNALPAGADELENTNGNADMIYYRRESTTDDAATGGAFDDQVMFLTANDLLEPLFRDGTMRAPSAAANEALQKIKLALIGHAMGNLNTNYGDSSCTGWGSTPRCRVIISADISNGSADAGNTDGLLPYNDLGITQAEAIDPWGMRYRYQPNANVINNGWGGGIASGTPSATTVAMTIFSQGPNRADGGGDDISIAITVNEVRAQLGSLVP